MNYLQRIMDINKKGIYTIHILSNTFLLHYSGQIQEIYNHEYDNWESVMKKMFSDIEGVMKW